MDKDGKTVDEGPKADPSISSISHEQLLALCDNLTEEELKALFIKKKLKSTDREGIKASDSYLSYRLGSAIDNACDDTIEHERYH